MRAACACSDFLVDFPFGQSNIFFFAFVEHFSCHWSSDCDDCSGILRLRWERFNRRAKGVANLIGAE